MAHPERSGAKSGNSAPWPKGVGRNLRTVERFEDVPDGISKSDPVSDSAFVGEGTLKTMNSDASRLEASGQSIQRSAIGNFPSEKRRAFSPIGMDHDPLPAIVHSERQRRRGTINELHAKELGAKGRPVVSVACPDADVTE
jgi:hypothetical protein